MDAIAPAEQATSQSSARLPSDVLLVDVNGLGYAAMYIPALSRLSFNGRATGGIHGALNSLFAAMLRQPDAVPFVLWDRPVAWRKAVLPEYKSNRSDTPEKVRIKDSYREQVPAIQLMLTALGIPQISCGEAEADDLAGVICRHMDPSWVIEMVSRDTDWYQAIRENVVWWSPVTRKHVDLAALADPANGLSDGHFLSPWEYLQAKALAGDTSDVIAGVEKVGLLTACKNMRAHGGTIESFWAAVDNGSLVPKGVVQTRLASADSRAIYQRNIRLMDWSLAPPLQTHGLALTAGEPDWAMAFDVAEEFGLSKALSQAKKVMAPWKDTGWGPAVDAIDSALHPDRCLGKVRPADCKRVPL